MFPKGFVGDVTRGLLASGADNLFPFGLGPNLRLDVRSVFFSDLLPPNRYVQITRTILTNLRLDDRLVFISDILPR